MRLLISIFLVAFLFSNQCVSQINRPQEPQKPFDYTIEEVIFTNNEANNIKLAGTLTIPKNIKKPPVAILISGSGPQNRNEELLNHKPFLVLSDFLTNNGIAVLRYDDRGIAESEGDFNTATSFDFATDVEAAIDYLKTRKEFKKSKIGLIGHSEGGLIAPIVASRNKEVSFAILLAGPGVSGDETLRTQNEKILTLSGANKELVSTQLEINENLYRIVKTEENDSISSKINTFLDNHLEENKDNPILPFLINDVTKKQYEVFGTPWMREFIRLNPELYLSKTKCPVLALNGSKDLQVLPKLNLNGIESALKKANNNDVTIKELKGLNHLFQQAETGLMHEYKTIEETFSPTALTIIKDWILERF